MYYIFMLLVFVIEWIVLMLFPLTVLGYNYKVFLKQMFLIGIIMSIFSILIRLIHTPMVLILALQVLLFSVLIKSLFRLKYFEVLVISSIGYGFYCIIQLLIAEVINIFSAYTYLEILFSNTNITIFLQLISIFLILGICYLLRKYKCHLSELKNHLQGERLNHKMKLAIIISSLLIFVFVCLVSFAMEVAELNHAPALIILCITLLFLILSVYFVLHTQIKIKNLIEAKKFHLDKEQQLAQIVEQLRKDALEHYQVIYKLCKRGDPNLSLDYMEKHNLLLGNLLATQPDQFLEAKERDELLYAFLKNKQKLAQLLGVELQVPIKIQSSIPIGLRKIRYLSVVIDELILALYQAPAYVDKKIKFVIETVDEMIKFDITSNIELEERDSTNLRLMEVILQLQRENAVVHSSIKPVHLSISSSLI